jgi:hypothetical protein
LSQIDLGGTPNESASELLTACDDFDQPTERDLTPLCALLAELRDQGLAGGRLKDRFEAITARLGCDTPVIDWPYDPYPGMLALDHHQAPIFFGRRAETLQLLTKLDTEQGRRLLMVAGASGCGKSSLVRAGLWATLKDSKQSRLRGSVDWAITAMIPSEPVRDPFQALVASLARAPEPVPGLGRERAEAAVARAGVDTPTVLPRVFSRLLTVQPDGAATRRREDWNHWQEDPKAHALIEALANQQTRLLVLSATPTGEPRATDAHPAAYGRSVEVAHEALFSAWPDLKEWIDKRREALIRRPQVERAAAHWDAHGRPDHLVPNPVIVTETRALLEAAELWDDMAKDPPAAG